MGASITRRGALGLASVLAAPAIAGCSDSPDSYAQIADELSSPVAFTPGEFPHTHLQLVHHARLAANGHNTQPWRFVLSSNALVLRPDYDRRTPVVDPDDHHLFASMGCAAENLSLAARAAGLGGEVEWLDHGLVLPLRSGLSERSERFAAIAHRQSTRLEYDGSALSAGERTRLLAAAEGDGRVSVAVFDSPSGKAELTELILEGNRRQIEDAAFVAELRDWIRFNKTEAAQLRDGLFTGATGNPEMPGWLGRRLFSTVFTADAENARIVRQVNSSAALIVLTADEATPSGWVEAGRASQRLQLEATVLGLKTAFLNQPVEVAALRPELAALLGEPGRRPDLVLRVGRGPVAPRMLRRPVEAMVQIA